MSREFFALALVATHASIPVLAQDWETMTATQARQAVQKGVDVNSRDELEMTPLMHAARANPDSGVIDCLLEAGAEPGARDIYNQTALMWAAKESETPEVVSALLSAGSEAGLRCQKNKTALDYTKENEALVGTPAYEELRDATRGESG